MSRYTEWLKEKVHCKLCNITTSRHFMMYVHIKQEKHIDALNRNNMCQYLNG